MAIDLNGDNQFTSIDSQIFLRYLGGLRGSALGIDLSDAAKTSLENGIAANALLDIDRNGNPNPAHLLATDGFLVSRHLANLRDNNLIRNALGDSAQRTTPSAIDAYILDDVRGEDESNREEGNLSGGANNGTAGGNIAIAYSNPDATVNIPSEDSSITLSANVTVSNFFLYDENFNLYPEFPNESSFKLTSSSITLSTNKITLSDSSTAGKTLELAFPISPTSTTLREVFTDLVNQLNDNPGNVSYTYRQDSNTDPVTRNFSAFKTLDSSNPWIGTNVSEFPADSGQDRSTAISLNENTDKNNDNDNDNDWYRINVPADISRLEVNLLSNVNLDLVLYDVDGNFLRSSAATDGNEQINIALPEATEARTYYIKVSPNSSLGDEATPYTLRWIGEDAYEENDSLETAYDLTNQEGVLLNAISGGGIQFDEDWYQINAESNSESLNVSLRFIHSEGDINVSLHNSEGLLIASSESTTDDESLTTIVPDAGDYYLKVSGSNQGNAYNLSWSSTPNLQLAPVSEEFKVNAQTVTTGTITNPDVAVAPNGDFVVVWQYPYSSSDRDLRFRRFNADGTPKDSSDRVLAESLSNEFSPSVAMTADGSFVVAYVLEESNGNQDVLICRFDAEGNQVGETITAPTTDVSTKNQFDPDIAIADNGVFGVVWTHEHSGSDTDIYARSFYSDGTPVSSTDEVVVNTVINESQPTLALRPGIAIDPDNPPAELYGIISWTETDPSSGNDVYFKQLNSTLDPSNRTLANSNVSREEDESAVAMDAAGNFVATWRVHVEGADDDNIEFRRFNAEGIPLSVIDEPVTQAFGDQDEPVITMTTDGQFVIAWEDDSDQTVKYQVFAADGTVITGSQFYAASPGFEDNPAIALTPDGSQMVIVADDDGSHSFDPWARIYQNTNLIPTPPSTVTVANRSFAANVAANEQEITANPSSLSATPGTPLQFDVMYDAVDQTLGTLGLRLHFNSNQLTYNNLTNLLNTNLLGQQVQDDTENFDGDSSTDKYILTLWADPLNDTFPGNFGSNDRARLYTANFTATSSFTGTTLNFTASALANGYTLKADPVSVTPIQLHNTSNSNQQLGLTHSGVTVSFDQPLNPDVLNLYQGQNTGSELPDVTLIGETTGSVRGSLVWDDTTNALTFMKTGGVLAVDNYTLTLASRSNGLIFNNGELLDGDGNGTAGGDYTANFSVTTTPERILSIPDFSRGAGQTVKIPTPATGIPLTINDGTNVRKLDFTLTYDPDLLSVTGVSLDANLPDSWQVTASNFDTAGQAIVSMSGTESLSSGENIFAYLTATVPNTAPNGSLGMLQFETARLNDGGISVFGDAAVQQVALFGDSTGNGAYSGLDASLIARVAVGLDTGFDAYPYTDPMLVGDTTGNGALSGLDASFVARTAVGLPQIEIPS